MFGLERLCPENKARTQSGSVINSRHWLQQQVSVNLWILHTHKQCSILFGHERSNFKPPREYMRIYEANWPITSNQK